MSELDVAITLQKDGYMVENSGTYYKVGKREGRILERVVNREDTKHILNEEKITEEQLNQLLESFKSMGVIGEQQKKKNHILFYRIPLLEADGMFGGIVDILKKHKVVDKVLLLLSIVVILVGSIFMTIHLGDIFSLSTLQLSWTGYVILYLSFLITICLHEFAHGIACKYVGGKVGTLGFMLIFFSPAMYCDISGIRMVDDKRKQIIASSAGIYVNVFFMAVASIIFAVWPLPIFAAFIIMSFTTIISNLIPVIRLDGYWILSFATGITNLYKKSLKGVGKLFGNYSLQERFIAVYGIITYIFMAVALGSVCVSVIGVVQYVVEIFI